MTWLYENVARPWLFTMDSEAIHDRTLGWLRRISQCGIARDAMAAFLTPERLPVECFGLSFANPVGLAAGMDKQGAAVPVWAAMGLGFSELGGVTAFAQDGNPRPRMFRALGSGALVNSMGFNNPGAATMAETLSSWRARGLWPSHPVGINLGKTKTAPLEKAAEDYSRSFRLLREHADFFVVNVSSPNTPGLRQLQDRAALGEILAALQSENRNFAPKPILVKIAPDLSFEAVDELLAVAAEHRVAGVVATNTTLERPPAAHASAADRAVFNQAGGLSGRPLRERSTEIVRHIYRQTRGRLPVVGVGGIFDAADAFEKITAGASLVQVYTGLVYRGPGIVRSIVDGLRRRLAEAGFSSVAQAVGTAAGK